MFKLKKRPPQLDNFTAQQLDTRNIWCVRALADAQKKPPAERYSLLHDYITALKVLSVLDEKENIEQRHDGLIAAAFRRCKGMTLANAGVSGLCIWLSITPPNGLILGAGFAFMLGAQYGISLFLQRQEKLAKAPHPALPAAYQHHARRFTQQLDAVEAQFSTALLAARDSILAATPQAEQRLAALFNRITDQGRFYEGLDTPLSTSGQRLTLTNPVRKG